MKKYGSNCRHFQSRKAALKHAGILEMKHGYDSVVVNVKLVKRSWNYIVCVTRPKHTKRR